MGFLSEHFMTSKSTGKLFLQGFLLVVLFFGLTRIVATSEGLFASIELAGLLFLLLLSVVGFVQYHKWGERAVFFVFLFYLSNLVLIGYFYGSLYLVILLASLFGFLVSLPTRSSPSKKDEKSASAVPSPVRDVPKPAEEAPKPKATFSPGKYVASKRSNVYHEPKCEWAKKIQKERRLWFVSKEEAWEKGYKAHGCLK